MLLICDETVLMKQTGLFQFLPEREELVLLRETTEKGVVLSQ